MDAKTRHLALLAALSLFCAGIAWIMDHAVGTGADFHQESIAVQTSSMNTMEFKSWDKLS